MKTENFRIMNLPFIFLLLFFSSAEVKAQEISRLELEQRAASYFENGQFDKSATDYETLHSLYPKEPEFAYLLGRSYLHSNQNITEAVDLLKYVATRNYGEDAYFFLAQAFLFSYKFEEAAMALKTFSESATEKLAEKYDVDYWIAVCENARNSTIVSRVVKVENLRIVPATAIESAFIDYSGGKYIYVPDEIKSEEDIAADYQTLMFIPKESNVGDYLYFDSKARSGKQGSDIYRVQRITPEDYTLPEALPVVINSAYDEAYPYFDKKSNTLYFSSKGHNTSGGFDIFKSVYDPVNNVWRTPEKLDFPINTPYDDFLYTPLSDNSSAIFLTDRHCGLHEAEAFTIKTNVQAEYISPYGPDDMITYALLAPSSIEVVNTALAERIVTEGVNNSLHTSVNSGSKPGIDEYSQLVGQALTLQSQRDSLNQAAKAIRSKAGNESDYRTQQELLANASTLDKEAKRLQRMADQKYAQAEQLRTPQNQAKTVQLDAKPAQQGITVLSYPQTTTSNSQPKSETSSSYEQGVNAAKSVSTEFTNNFSINGSSPYSAERPIPVAFMPEGLIYRIQLGSYSKPLPENTFGGLEPVSKEKGMNETKYFVGYFSTVSMAREALDQVKEYGYPDAFIVSYFNTKKISIQQAREIEFAEK